MRFRLLLSSGLPCATCTKRAQHLAATCERADVADTWATLGYVAFADDPREHWRLFDFVESLHAQHNDRLIAELDARLATAYVEANRTRGDPYPEDEALLMELWRRVAMQVTDVMEETGVRVASSNLPSMVNHEERMVATGPRFYISVDTAWKRMYGDAVLAMPRSLQRRLWPDAEELASSACRAGATAAAFLHNAGWTLVPPDSDAQAVHRDWGSVRGMRHILWTSPSSGPTVT
jgi:hypothetical protein